MSYNGHHEFTTLRSFDVPYKYRLEASLYALDWNNYTSVAVIALISYEYMLQFEKKEVTFVWVRAQPQRYEDTELTDYAAKRVVRYFGIVVAMNSAIWGGLFYMPEAPYVRSSFYG
ncbi:hypothetical protein DFJ58DRAFT_723795 [Suillus subalutaceus]|uniref:uncharacterized protein n=1 Tax=Suillus subalutaceus TaxID=48586 RepID=UPI001B86FCD8|nr:uncharacterized protein DFJ58DRAFT_723795 [Suillus subalutaceus]KAG1867930.1 hypothetical protein DFJ58DRAFT_723795 [Suillus subalutaceus]